MIQEDLYICPKEKKLLIYRQESLVGKLFQFLFCGISIMKPRLQVIFLKDLQLNQINPEQMKDLSYILFQLDGVTVYLLVQTVFGLQVVYFRQMDNIHSKMNGMMYN
jgi:hypothetical protein